MESMQVFAEMHAKARARVGKSQEYMALELGVTRKTVANWEKGESSPSFWQSLEWFRILGLNPFPYYLGYVYPNTIKNLRKKDSSKEDIDRAFDDLCKTLPESARRAILYLFYGEHGSEPQAVIQLLLAHLHSSLPSRITEATVTEQLYNLEHKVGKIVCPDNILPDMDVVHKAIVRATEATIENGQNYIIDERRKI